MSNIRTRTIDFKTELEDSIVEVRNGIVEGILKGTDKYDYYRGYAQALADVLMMAKEVDKKRKAD